MLSIINTKTNKIGNDSESPRLEWGILSIC